jgi:hypothetical protein
MVRNIKIIKNNIYFDKLKVYILKMVIINN